MTADAHSDFFRHACSHHITDARTAKVVRSHAFVFFPFVTFRRNHFGDLAESRRNTCPLKFLAENGTQYNTSLADCFVQSGGRCRKRCEPSRACRPKGFSYFRCSSFLSLTRTATLEIPTQSISAETKPNLGSSLWFSTTASASSTRLAMSLLMVTSPSPRACIPCRRIPRHARTRCLLLRVARRGRRRPI
jgi:hypothetical protein